MDSVAVDFGGYEPAGGPGQGDPGQYGGPPQQQQGYGMPPTAAGHSTGQYSQPPPAQQQYYTQPPGATPTAGGVFSAFGGDPAIGSAVGAAAAQLGQQHLTDAAGKVSKYVNIKSVKFYFQVNTNYVIAKLKLLLLPFLPSTVWRRVEKDGKSLPPKDDVNAPDLYIPTMAFLTYVLIVALGLGTHGKWSPELLGTLLSSTIGWITFEVFFCFSALWLMSVPSHPLLELAAFCSYKFVGMVFSLLTFLVTANTSLYMLVVGWNSISTGYFLIQTIRGTSSDELENHPEAKQKALYVAVAMAVFQGLMMFWFTWSVVSTLSATDDANASKDAA